MRLPRDAAQSQLLRSRDAMYGRTTYYAGPIPSYVQTYPGSGLTPAKIHAIHNEVLVAGWMANKACLDEQVILRDGHMFAVDKSVRGAISSKPHFVRPFDRSDLARGVCKYVQAVVDQIHSFPNSQYELLGAHASGYALQEIVWKRAKINFDGGKTIRADVPTSLETVHNKHTRFDLPNNRPVLDMGHGKFCELPLHKFLYHVTPGDGPARRRGYMYQVVYLHQIKHEAIARWAVVLDIWGIPVPHGKVDLGIWQDEARKSEYEQVLINAGKGQPFLTTDEFEITKAFETSTGDARGMHAALIGWVNSEISKAVQLETLTTEIGGGPGSYKLSETHENTKETGDRMLARAIEDTNRDQLFTAIVERATYEYDDLGNRVGVLRGGLCDLLGADADDILHVVPRSFYRIDREMGPQARSQIYKDAVDLGLKIEKEQYADEFGLNLVEDKDLAIPGKPVDVADGSKVVSTIEATEGTENPKDVPTPAPGAKE